MTYSEVSRRKGFGSLAFLFLHSGVDLLDVPDTEAIGCNWPFYICFNENICSCLSIFHVLLPF